MDRVPLEEANLVEAVPDVHLAGLAAGESMSVQYFRVDPGATLPSHEHHHEQVGYVYRGELTFLVGDPDDPTELAVGPGGSYSLESHEVHGAENRGDEPVEGIDVFSPPRVDPDWAE